MAEAALFLGFDLAVMILAAVLACMRVFRCSLSRPARKAARDG